MELAKTIINTNQTILLIRPRGEVLLVCFLLHLLAAAAAGNRRALLPREAAGDGGGGCGWRGSPGRIRALAGKGKGGGAALAFGGILAVCRRTATAEAKQEKEK